MKCNECGYETEYLVRTQNKRIYCSKCESDSLERMVGRPQPKTESRTRNSKEGLHLICAPKGIGVEIDKCGNFKDVGVVYSPIGVVNLGKVESKNALFN